MYIDESYIQLDEDLFLDVDTGEIVGADTVSYYMLLLYGYDD